MDTIANMLTQIRNAQAVNHKSCLVSFSKINEEIIKILKKENYIRGYRVEEKGIKKSMRILLGYDRGDNPLIHHLQRISKPGRRIYTTTDKVPYVLSGMGYAIISTSKGLMTDKQARESNIGGEVLCKVW